MCSSNTYGEGQGACAHGTLIQVIDVMRYVDEGVINKYAECQKRDSSKLTEANSAELVSKISHDLVNNFVEPKKFTDFVSFLAANQMQKPLYELHETCPNYNKAYKQ